MNTNNILQEELSKKLPDSRNIAQTEERTGECDSIVCKDRRIPPYKADMAPVEEQQDPPALFVLNEDNCKMCFANDNEPRQTKYDFNKWHFPQEKTLVSSKPKIEFYSRDVEFTSWVCGFTSNCQHGYTLFKYSDGTVFIYSGGPDTDMIRGNLRASVVPYTVENSDKLFPKNDWDMDNSRKPIQKWELQNDDELDYYLSEARKAANDINTGNKGGSFDYDLCVRSKCSGQNSNTVQLFFYKNIGIELKIPKNLKFPGIKGEFYDGPIDDFAKKWGEELQKEQP